MGPTNGRRPARSAPLPPDESQLFAPRRHLQVRCAKVITTIIIIPLLLAPAKNRGGGAQSEMFVFGARAPADRPLANPAQRLQLAVRTNGPQKFCATFRERRTLRAGERASGRGFAAAAQKILAPKSIYQTRF